MQPTIAQEIDSTSRPGALRRLVVGGAAAAVVLLGVTGCASSGDEEGTQPAPGVTSFQQGDFGDVPLPDRSDPVGTRSETDGVVTQTFAARDTTVDALIDFFDSQLPAAGWEPAEAYETENGIYRGDFTKDGRRLEVVIDQVPDLPEDETGGAQPVQFSLILNPDLEDNPVFTGTTQAGS